VENCLDLTKGTGD